MRIHQTLVQVLCRQYIRPIKGERDLSEYVRTSQLNPSNNYVYVCVTLRNVG